MGAGIDPQSLLGEKERAVLAKHRFRSQFLEQRLCDPQREAIVSAIDRVTYSIRHARVDEPDLVGIDDGPVASDVRNEQTPIGENEMRRFRIFLTAFVLVPGSASDVPHRR